MEKFNRFSHNQHTRSYYLLFSLPKTLFKCLHNPLLWGEFQKIRWHKRILEKKLEREGGGGEKENEKRIESKLGWMKTWEKAWQKAWQKVSQTKYKKSKTERVTPQKYMLYYCSFLYEYHRNQNGLKSNLWRRHSLIEHDLKAICSIFCEEE